ncbi:MAG: ribosome assembly factor SBDS [Promethearchaeota archaeon]
MSNRPQGSSKRIDLGKYIIARLKRNKKVAEMIVDPIKAWNAVKLIEKEIIKRKKESENPEPLTVEDIKKMPEIDINDIFVSFTVFEDVKKGDVYPNIILEEMFETDDGMEIAYIFLWDRDTEWLWTKEQRDAELEKKKRKIINIIAKNCINPQTKKPHPPQRIEKAMKEVKYNITDKPAEEQVKDVIKAIASVLPIRMENVELAVKVPASYAAKAYGTVEKFGSIKQDEWQNDGSWVGILDLPAGLEAEFLDKINKLTHGRAQIKILKRT